MLGAAWHVPRIIQRHTPVRVSESPVPADHTLRIACTKLELARGIQIETLSYNDRVPGPVLRLRKGREVNINVENASDAEELVHWHGLAVSAMDDGTMEEGSAMIAPGESRRYSLAPCPGGTRWYHTHTRGGTDFTKSTYSGQFGFLIVEDGQDSGGYDQEVLLAIHHWEPTPMRSSDHSCKLKYRYACFNDKICSAAEPVKVRPGERVLFRLLNASATENVTLSFAGHHFEVVALDGNSVPRRTKVGTLSLAVAERVDAVVEMTNPGVWILGSTSVHERASGLGIPVEYAGASGPAVWREPLAPGWQYTSFGTQEDAPSPEQTFPMVFQRFPKADEIIDTWMINGHTFPHTAPIVVEKGKRYRLAFYDASGCAHPLHLHRHSFELVSVHGKPTRGILKDVVNLPAYGHIEVDFFADNPGSTLFHCHQQLHMDGGFAQIIEYKGIAR